MKPSPAWIELSLVAGALMAGMLVVMWAQRPAGDCTLLFETPRALVLSRETDREHLANDLASADRIARRYMLSTANPAEQHTRLADCQAILVQQIATRHSLSPEQVRARSTAPR